jgi:hypothetical protein
MDKVYMAEHAKEQVACIFCSKLTDGDEAFVFSYKSSFVACCPECHKKKFRICPHCEQSFLRSIVQYHTDEGEYICEGCASTHYVTCYSSHLFVKKSKAVYKGGYYFSPFYASEYDECDECKTLMTNRNFVQNGGVCTSCLRKVILEWNVKTEGILNFMLDPYTVKGKTTRYYGVELEVEHITENSKKNSIYKTAKEVNAFFNCKKDPFVITKRDGSLRNGFEIVTAPATYGVHESWWNAFFKEFKEHDEMVSFTRTCGMHIHVSKNSLTPMQIGKILVFVYNPSNRYFIRDVAQRSSGRYNNFSNPKNVKDAFGGNWIASEGRYTAINLMNANTVEFRLFKGTMDKKKFFKNMEFVKALIDFCGTGNCSIQESKDYRVFCKYVEKYSSVYPNLFRFLVSKHYCFFKSEKIVGKRRLLKKKEKKVNRKISIDSVVLNLEGQSDCINNMFVAHSNHDRKTILFAKERKKREKIALKRVFALNNVM